MGEIRNQVCVILAIYRYVILQKFCTPLVAKQLGRERLHFHNATMKVESLRIEKYRISSGNKDISIHILDLEVQIGDLTLLPTGFMTWPFTGLRNKFSRDIANQDIEHNPCIIYMGLEVILVLRI